LERVPDHQSQTPTPLEDNRRQSYLSPELGSRIVETENFRIAEPIEQRANSAGFDPTGFGGSQDSDLSEFALDTRLQAFQTVLDNAKGKIGGEVRLLSTTDNHSTLEPELGHAVTQPSGSVSTSTCGAAL